MHQQDALPCLSPSELCGASLYEHLRPRLTRLLRPRLRVRRLRLPGSATLLFEDRETVLFAVQELLRADGDWSVAARARAIAELGGLVPGPGEVTATCFIDGANREKAGYLAHALARTPSPLALSLPTDSGAMRIPAQPIAPPGTESAAVHYLRWRLPEPAIVALRDEPAGAAVQLGKAGLSLEVALPAALCLELSAQLELGAANPPALLADKGTGPAVEAPPQLDRLPACAPWHC